MFVHKGPVVSQYYYRTKLVTLNFEAHAPPTYFHAFYFGELVLHALLLYIYLLFFSLFLTIKQTYLLVLLIFLKIFNNIPNTLSENT